MSLKRHVASLCATLIVGIGLGYYTTSRAEPAPIMPQIAEQADGDAVAATDPAELIRKADVDSRFSVGAPLHHKGLTVYPVLDNKASSAKPKESFLTLEEAMRMGVIEVSELGDGGSVPTLKIDSSASQPVIGTTGDVVLGGQQDRVLTEDIILEPGKSTEVAVNCVEQGRWGEGEMGDEFAYGGRSELALQRVLRRDRDQGATWSAVSELNSAKATNLGAAGMDPSTGTYRASLQNDRVESTVDEYIEKILPELSSQEKAVGVIVAYGGQITSFEIYYQTALFEKDRESILESAALEAISRGVRSGSPPPTSAAAQVLSEAMAARTTETSTKDSAKRTRRESERTVSYELADDEAGALKTLGYVQ